jgi:hypothetical protein
VYTCAPNREEREIELHPEPALHNFRIAVTAVTLVHTKGIHNFQDLCYHLYSSSSSAMQRWMIVLAYLGSQCTQLHGCILLFGVMYLTSFHFATDPTKEQHQILCKSRKKCDGDASNDQTSVRRRKPEPYTERQNFPRPKKVRQAKSKVKSMLIIFFDIKRIVHKKIRPGKPNSQFRILLWRFMATAWKCVKTSSRTLATREFAVA